jgi:DNA-directed RNA polymerase III subunit RPC6
VNHLTHDTSIRTSSLDSDSKLIYNWIRDSGSEGIWTKDLKKHTNLHINVVNRVLKALEHKQLVKSVKHVKVCLLAVAL